VALASRSDGILASTPPQAAASAQQPATSGHDSLALARQDLDALLGDLADVCGQLEELATTLRREHASGTPRRRLSLAFPHRLQGAARQLAATLQALVEASPEPGLSASAVAQIAALRGEVAAAASDRPGQSGGSTPGHDPGTALLAGIERTLSRAMTRQQSLISRLDYSAEAPVPGERPADARGKPPVARDEPPR
jgi:hypothetical protein